MNTASPRRSAAASGRSEALSAVAEQLTAAQLACEEAARAAARLADELQAEPGELEAVAERLHELQTLKRKHGIDPDHLVERLSQMRESLAELDNAEERELAASAAEQAGRIACLELAQQLHEQRAAAGQGLCDAVVAELAALHLAGARLSVTVTADHADQPGPRGVDKVEFLFSANTGEPLAPLSRVASGGELSRLLLAIKGALAGEDRVATYVFDEVDAGVGGRVAEAIGRRVSAAARGHQVLCVTHLPQIAAFASSHLRVDKATKGGRTTTRVATLSEHERAQELARMLGGGKASATQHAHTLLAQARKPATRSRKRA